MLPPCRKRGRAALWPLGRHAAARAGRPRPHPIQRPQPADAARQRQWAGNPRGACRCGRCSLPLPALAGRQTSPGLPARFQRAGGGALPPLLNRSVGAPIPTRAGICWRLPRQRADRVGTVRLAGRRLNAWPHNLRCGPRPGGRPVKRTPYDWAHGYQNIIGAGVHRALA